MQGAWKVGLLVVVFGVLAYAAYNLLGSNFSAGKTDIYYADFDDASGATPGTPVQMAGVRIGQVEKVELTTPKTARLTLAIERQYHIPTGSEAEIQGSLIGLGPQPLTIIPPESLAAANLPARSIIKGIHPSPLDTYLPQAKDTFNELNKTLVATRQLLQDDHLKGGISKVLETSSKTLEQFGELAQHANLLLNQNQANITRAVASAANAMSDIQKSTAIVAKLAKDPHWREQSMAILDNLAATSKKAQTLVANLNDFVTDPKLRQPINESLRNTATITDTGTRIAANTEEMSKNGIVMTKKAIEIEDKAKDLEDDAKGVLDRLKGVFSPKHAAPLLSGVSANLDLLRETHPGHTRTDVNVTVPIGKDKVHFGLYDAFESNKINAEFGQHFGTGSELLYGVYASKPSIGVDYQLAPRLFLRGDLFDVNSPRADVRARIEFGKGFYGWLGVEQLFHNNAPVIGIGFRK
jgi:phospholipid/cholesterol/gamma-HCH transport system substrate-binding protein